MASSNTILCLPWSLTTNAVVATIYFSPKRLANYGVGNGSYYLGSQTVALLLRKLLLMPLPVGRARTPSAHDLASGYILIDCIAFLVSREPLPQHYLTTTRSFFTERWPRHHLLSSPTQQRRKATTSWTPWNTSSKDFSPTKTTS